MAYETSRESHLEYCHELAVGKGPVVGAKWESEATYEVACHAEGAIEVVIPR